MASLKVVSDRCDDNSHKIAVVIPPRRNGEPNMGALDRVIHALHGIMPDAFDPVEVPHTIEAPMPPLLDVLPPDADDDMGLTAGTAVQS